MVLYHEITPDTLQPVLKNGIHCTSRGEKGNDELIKKTDEYLDTHRPAALKEQGVCRDNNVYALMGSESTIADIQSGEDVPLEEFLHNDKVLLKLNVPAEDCFVSNLDLYDTVKAALKNGHEHTLKNATVLYWEAVVPLKKYRGTYPRPEVMITRDISPKEMALVS